MVNQYPYSLKVLVEVEAVFNESTGDWTQGSSRWVDFGKCRDEINGGGSRVTTLDGENYVYSAVIYLPKDAKGVNNGAKIQVFDRDVKRLEGTVVRFGKDQLHSRLWL